MDITPEHASIIAATLVFLGTCVTAYMNGPGANLKETVQSCEEENDELQQSIAELHLERTRMLDRVLRFLDDAIWRLEQSPPDMLPRVLEGAKALKGWLEAQK